MKGGFSTVVLVAGVAAFALACHHAVQSVREAGARAEENRKARVRIESLDDEYRVYIGDEVAAGRLLDQRERAGGFRAAEWFAEAAKEAGAEPPAVTVRAMAESIGGQPLREATAVWADVDPAAFQKVLEKAEASEPPIRLRRVEIKARTGGRVSVEAAFATL